uniref:Uncharacterized protein n=1 Tax=Schistosoma haematobium TaxID=6185 RepID=A0A094ZPP2_SCHHA
MIASGQFNKISCMSTEINQTLGILHYITVIITLHLLKIICEINVNMGIDHVVPLEIIIHDNIHRESTVQYHNSSILAFESLTS